MKLYKKNGKLLYEGDKYDLHHRNLSGGDFSEIGDNSLDLRFCNLCYCKFGDSKYYDFRYSNLTFADFTNCDISQALFEYSNLHGVKLKGAKVNWNNHDLLSHILKVEAGDDIEKLKVAGIIRLRRDWCWDRFLGTNDPLKDWALEMFRSYRYVEDL